MYIPPPHFSAIFTISTTDAAKRRSFSAHAQTIIDTYSLTPPERTDGLYTTLSTDSIVDERQRLRADNMMGALLKAAKLEINNDYSKS